MVIPIHVKVNCLLETGKVYPVTEGYYAEQYILDTMAYNLGLKMMAELPITVTPSDVLTYEGLPESYNYSTEALVFTDEQLKEFVKDTYKAIAFDTMAKNMLDNCNSPIV